MQFTYSGAQSLKNVIFLLWVVTAFVTAFVTDLKPFSPQPGNGAPPPLAPRNMANI